MNIPKMQFFMSIKSINDSALYKHSRAFPEISPEKIDENFSLNDEEDKFNTDDQNINNIIIETSDHNLDYIKRLISCYKETLNDFSPKEKRLITVIFINVIIDINFELDLHGNYDFLFYNDIYPPNPTQSDLFDFIRKMNFLQYNLFSHIKPEQQEEFLETIKSTWEKNDIQWIYNFLLFINQIIKNNNESVFTVFTNSSFFTDSLLPKSFDDQILFKIVSKTIIANSKVLLNQKTFEHLYTTFKYKEHRKSLILWISTGLRTFSKLKSNEDDTKIIIHNLLAVFSRLLEKEDLELDEINYALKEITTSFDSIETTTLLTSDLVHQILIQLSTFSKLSTDYYFNFLALLNTLNTRYELFDNSLFDPVFDNLKNSTFQKVDIEKLWDFTLRKDVNNNRDRILNWRGVELILSYINVDESSIAEKLQSMVMIKSNLYEFHKANLTKFLIKRINEIQENKKLFQAYYFTLELMVSCILTEQEMFELIKLIQLNSFIYSIEIIQIFLNIIQKPLDQFNPKSFFRFDRDGQHLYGPKRRITDSHSICFSFRLTQKVDDATKYELFKILHHEQKSFCTFYIHNKALNVEMLNKESTSISVVNNFQVKEEEWNFIEFSINSKYNLLRLRVNDMEKYIDYKILLKRNSITDIFKKESGSKSYQILIESTVFDYSNFYVLSNLAEGKRPSFYFMMSKEKMDLMKIKSVFPNNLNYCLYCTFKDDRKSSNCKCIRNYNLENQNEIENDEINFFGRTITNATNIFDIMESVDIRKFFFPLFDKLNSNSVFQPAQGQSFLLKLLQIFESLNFTKTKMVEILSISLNSIDPKFVTISEISKCFDLWNSLNSRKVKREFLQSIFFNFAFVSKLKPQIQVKLFKMCQKIQRLEVKSFESLLFNAIIYYGTESNISDSAWSLLTKIFNPNNQNDIDSIITTTMKNISNYVTIQCTTILIDTLTKIEHNENLNTKKLFSLSVFLTTSKEIEIQILGVKLFCLIERYFNIAENKSSTKQTPINSSKYVYQMILTSNIDHETNEFDLMTQTIFNFLIPDTEIIQSTENSEKQIKLNPIISSSTEVVESTNEIKISNITIFPLVVYYSTFCSTEITKKMIDLFILNINSNYLSSLLDLNSWYFWITNFLFQYKDKDLTFFAEPFIQIFYNEITFQSSTNKIIELFMFLKIYSSKINLNFDYRLIKLIILTNLLTKFNESNSAKEISLLYPIIYSCLQIEIKNDNFELTGETFKFEEKNEADEKLFNLFTNRYLSSFNNYSTEGLNFSDQNLRLLLIQTVLNLKENVSVNLKGCDKNEIYLLTSFILVDYINENKDGNNEQLITNYKNTILRLQTKYSKKYKKCLEILPNISNKELILSLEKKILSKYFTESKKIIKNKIYESINLFVNDLKSSGFINIQSEGKKCQEICLILLRKDDNFADFLDQHFNCFDSTREEKIGREKLRIQRIQNSFKNENSKNTLNEKYKILNQISLSGTRNLMSINNTFTNHIDDKIKWLGKIDVKRNYVYRLNPYSRERIKTSLNCKLLTLTEVFNGCLFIIENRIVFYSSLKTVEIKFTSILFIFNRLFSDFENDYQGCEIFTDSNRSFYFVFDVKRDLFYQYLPDYNAYLALLSEKYSMNDQKKAVDLNFDDTLKFDFLGTCRKVCQSIYQNQPSPTLFTQLNLTLRWQNRVITNYEYLYFLNMLSNRSYHIASRYPYYPNLLRKFDSETIQITDASNYRDLKIPVIFHFNESVECFPLNCFPLSDHSISYLMVRVEPFTTLMFCINDQKFDKRLISSALMMWQKDQANSSTELIPEVFSMPFYLVNENRFDFGKKSDGEVIDDVVLPKWSKNNFVFTSVQRLMLESDVASKDLAKWIDMTFGSTQNKYEGKTLFNTEFRASLVGCLPDQLYKNHNHPDRFQRTTEISPTNSATAKEPANATTSNNAGSNSSGVGAVGGGGAGVGAGAGGFVASKSPLFKLLKPSDATVTSRPIVRGIVKEFIHYKKGDSFFVVDTNQSPFSVMNVPNNCGELLCASRPLKLAIFGSKDEDFLTVLNLQKKSISIQCHTVSKIKCVTTIGGRFVVTGGGDCVVRVWDMLHGFSLSSSSCFHQDEVIAVSGCRNTGLLASIDSSMNLVIETLYDRKLIAFVPLKIERKQKSFGGLNLEVTKSGFILIAEGEKLIVLDSRGREVQVFKKLTSKGENENISCRINLYYDLDSREIVAVYLSSGELLVIDLINFDVFGRYEFKPNTNAAFCTMKRSRAVLLFDGEKTKSLIFGKIIPQEISNKENTNEVGEMEIFNFDNDEK